MHDERLGAGGPHLLIPQVSSGVASLLNPQGKNSFPLLDQASHVSLAGISVRSRIAASCVRCSLAHWLVHHVGVNVGGRGEI